jgi:hypothetical protein
MHRRLERFVLEGAHALTAVNQELVDEVLQVARGRALSHLPVPICYDQDLYESARKIRRIPAANTLRLSYFGTLYDGRSLDGLASAIERCLDTARSFEIEITFVGCVAPPCLKRISERSSRCRVHSTRARPIQELLDLLEVTDALLLVTTENYLAEHTTKLFDYMAMCRPILAIAPPKGAAARLITRHGLGLVAAHADVEGLSGCLETLAERRVDLEVAGAPKEFEARQVARTTVGFVSMVLGRGIANQPEGATQH